MWTCEIRVYYMCVSLHYDNLNVIHYHWLHRMMSTHVVYTFPGVNTWYIHFPVSIHNIYISLMSVLLVVYMIPTWITTFSDVKICCWFPDVNFSYFLDVNKCCFSFIKFTPLSIIFHSYTMLRKWSLTYAWCSWSPQRGSFITPMPNMTLYLWVSF